MRVVRLHGIEDARVERLAVPDPQPGELLARIEACGVCPTDARKFALGVNDGEYPFNPGHEWVGRIQARGAGVPAEAWPDGARIYGDTYAGYAEYATISVVAEGWSRGALPVGELPLERAVFVEPLADCLHCVHDQGLVTAASRVTVLGLGAMGLQIAAVAARSGAEVLGVEPRPERRELAAWLGAAATDPSSWQNRSRELWGSDGPDVVVVTIARPESVMDAVQTVAARGRVVLFAGFGDNGVSPIDLNRIHYAEISVVGSEWVGAPPGQRLEHYEAARDMLASGELRLERLVSDRVGLDDVGEALRSVREQRSLKTVLYPGGVP